MDREAVGAPGEGLVILQYPRRAHALGQGEKGLSNIVDIVDLPRAPEYFHLFEIGQLVGGYGDGDAALVGEVIALALVAVMMSVQDLLDLGDAQVGEFVEYGATAEIDEQGFVAVADDIDITGVVEEVKIVGEFF